MVQKKYRSILINIIEKHLVDDKMKEQILKHGVLWKS